MANDAGPTAPEVDPVGVPTAPGRRPVDRAVIDGMLAPFILLDAVRDPDGRIVDLMFADANEAACRYNGIPYERLVGARMLRLFPTIAEGVFQRYAAVVETGEPLVLDEVVIENDLQGGTERYYDIRAVKVGDGLSLSWVDVTERHQAATALAASERRYRMLAENAADVVYELGPDGHVRWISPSVTQALGWSVDDLLGRRLGDLIHPEDSASTSQEREALHRGDHPAGSADFLVRMRHQDGGYVWAAGSGRVLRDPDGTPTGTLVTGRVVQDLVLARMEAEEQRSLLASVMDALADPHVLLEPVRDDTGEVVDFRFTAANAAAVAATRAVVPGPLVGRLMTSVVGLELLQATFDEYVRVLETGEPLVRDDVATGADRDGQQVWLDIRTTRVGDLLSNTWRDVTDRHAAAQAVAESESRYRLLAENASDVVWQVAADGRLEWVSESTEKVLGWRPEQVLGTVGMDLVHPDDRARAVSGREPVVRGGAGGGDFRFQRADGSYVWMSLTAHSVTAEDGSQLRVVGLRDISGEIAAREDLAYLAYHDELTGLRNRSWVLDMLGSDLAASARDSRSVGVLFVDLDNFKVVNDSLGHAAGDVVLRAVAQRIAASLRPGDRVGRFGGDEFIVIATDIDSPLDAEAIAQRISLSLAAPLDIEGHVIVPTASIGIAISGPGSTPASLLRDTDVALFRAKDAGRARWQFFDQAMHTEALARLTIEAEIRKGLAEGQFVVEYQPVVDLGTGELVSHEALVRWQHPTRGLLPPAAFLPVAEESGLVVDIGAVVLEQVCRLLAERADVLGRVGVNVSPVALARPGWVDRFLHVLASHGVDPGRICVEITETAALSILDSPHDLHRLRDVGVGIHVDDFGTGYSSITLLRDLPVSGLKLDLSFTQRVADDPTAAVLSRGLALLAQGLGLVGVAEGIETEEQARLLREQGWVYGQGYLYGRPAAEPRVGPATP